MANGKDLLDDLHGLVGCTYLSDLRVPSKRADVIKALAQYTPAQWRDAARYLLT